MALNYRAPFGFFFNDKAWLKKLAIASLLTCSLIGAAPVFGWTMSCAARRKICFFNERVVGQFMLADLDVFARSR
jgi:hypothetical protein